MAGGNRESRSAHRLDVLGNGMAGVGCMMWDSLWSAIKRSVAARHRGEMP